MNCLNLMMVLVIIVFVLSMVLEIAGTVWVAWDANKKGMDPAMIWVHVIGVLVYFTSFTGLIIFDLLGK